MREERLLSYLKGACPGRKNRVSGTEPEKALNLSGLSGTPAQAQRSGLCWERRSDGAGELFAARRKRASAVRDDERKLINRLRRRGVPIASDRQGYFYAATAGEVYGTIRQLRQMVDGLEKAIAGLEAALETFGEAGGDRDAGFPTRAQRSGSCGERRSDEASELLPQGVSERAESATT